MILITRISQNPNYPTRTNRITRTPTPIGVHPPSPIYTNRILVPPLKPRTTSRRRSAQLRRHVTSVAWRMACNASTPTMVSDGLAIASLSFVCTFACAYAHGQARAYKWCNSIRLQIYSELFFCLSNDLQCAFVMNLQRVCLHFRGEKLAK
jgi:hypothetical protein